MSTNHDIINELRKSYAMELETVENYLANSIDLDGVRAEEIKKALARDIEEELGHARKLGNRIKVLEGRVPGSPDLDRGQRYFAAAERQHRLDCSDSWRDPRRGGGNRSIQETDQNV